MAVGRHSSEFFSLPVSILGFILIKPRTTVFSDILI